MIAADLLQDKKKIVIHIFFSLGNLSCKYKYHSATHHGKGKISDTCLGKFNASKLILNYIHNYLIMA